MEKSLKETGNLKFIEKTNEIPFSRDELKIIQKHPPSEVLEKLDIKINKLNHEIKPLEKMFKVAQKNLDKYYSDPSAVGAIFMKRNTPERKDLDLNTVNFDYAQMNITERKDNIKYYEKLKTEIQTITPEKFVSNLSEIKNLKEHNQSLNFKIDSLNNKTNNIHNISNKISSIQKDFAIFKRGVNELHTNKNEIFKIAKENKNLNLRTVSPRLEKVLKEHNLNPIKQIFNKNSFLKVNAKTRDRIVSVLENKRTNTIKLSLKNTPFTFHEYYHKIEVKLEKLEKERTPLKEKTNTNLQTINNLENKNNALYTSIKNRIETNPSLSLSNQIKNSLKNKTISQKELNVFVNYKSLELNKKIPSLLKANNFGKVANLKNKLALLNKFSTIAAGVKKIIDVGMEI